MAAGGDELDLPVVGQQRQDSTAGGVDINQHAGLPGTEIILVPEIERMHRLVRLESEIGPFEQNRRKLFLIIVKQANNIIITLAVELANLNPTFP